MLAAFLPTFLSVLFSIICFLLIIVVLLQKGRGGGLGAALGGAGTSAFGTKTGDVFTWVTIVLTGAFLLLAIGTSLAYRPEADRVDMPRFQPQAKPISEPTPVQIFTQALRTTIHYTLDGSEPTEQSPQIANGGFVRVEPGSTLRAKAYRAGWEPSPATPAGMGIFPEAETTTAPATQPGELPSFGDADALPAETPDAQED